MAQSNLENLLTQKPDDLYVMRRVPDNKLHYIERWVMSITLTQMHGNGWQMTLKF
jgi:hypothetical protein